jgi:hypothetical protein
VVVLRHLRHPAVALAVLLLPVALIPFTPAAASDGATQPPFSTTLSPVAVPPGGWTVVTVTHAAPDQPVTLQEKDASGWRQVGAAKTNSAGTASIRFVARAKSPRTVTLRAVSTPEPGGASGSTPSEPSTGQTLRVAIEFHRPGRHPHDYAFFNRPAHHLPTRWNPCQPVHYRLNIKRAPRGALTDINEALRRVRQITGLRFVYDGKTKFIPQFPNTEQREPLVIAYPKPSQSNYWKLAPDEDGFGGVTWHGKHAAVDHGFAIVRSDLLKQTTPAHMGFGTGLTDGGILLHELGHAVGLAHASHPDEIMYPSPANKVAALYGPGDYNGLRILGRRTHSCG